MQSIDKKFAAWIKSVGQDVEDVTSYCGWPSEWSDAPYLEDLQHVLNDGAEDLGVAIPDEFIAYRLSKWAGTKVPTDHPLVKNHDRWRSVYFDIEWDNSNLEDELGLNMLVRSIAGPEVASNLSTEEDVREHYSKPTHSGAIYMMQVGDRLLYLTTNEETIAIMDQDGEIKMFDYEGNRLHRDEDMSRVRGYIVGGLKMSRPLTDAGELASIVGNTMADLLTNPDISIMDLP